LELLSFLFEFEKKCTPQKHIVNKRKGYNFPIKFFKKLKELIEENKDNEN
jgi:hypothetical protein